MGNIASKEGYSALFKGVSASMIGVIHPLVFFPIYESTKFYLKNNFEEPGAEKLSTKNLLFSSIVSKVIACSISYPHEVLRSRLMYDKMGPDGVK